jgi:hypothetical protein
VLAKRNASILEVLNSDGALRRKDGFSSQFKDEHAPNAPYKSGDRTDN